jgi:hypothetical protein
MEDLTKLGLGILKYIVMDGDSKINKRDRYIETRGEKKEKGRSR